MAKKHVSQMTKGEKKYLEQRFNSTPEWKWSFNTYSKHRAVTRGVDMSVLRSIWTEGYELIEFHKHEETGSNRILLRSILTDKNENQVCVVFNFTTMEITTCYLNYRKNKHDNLVWSEYDKNLDIKHCMKHNYNSVQRTNYRRYKNA